MGTRIMTEREKAKRRLADWWQHRVDEAILRGFTFPRLDPYTDPTLAHLDPDIRPGMAALREGADAMGKR